MANCTAGSAFRKNRLLKIETLPEPVITTNKAVMVPIPNININSALCQATENASAPARAIYTKPQGKSPLNRPKTKAEDCPHLCIALPSLFCQRLRPLRYQTDRCNNVSGVIAIKNNKINNAPASMDMFCCQPDWRNSWAKPPTSSPSAA